jgi:phosphoribosyl 1,2-cyclic phosphodiesterase
MTLSVTVLYSGSKGNSVFYRCGDDTLLIDAGKSCRCLCRSLEMIGELPVRDIFITHEHADHVSALEVYLKKHGANVHMTSASAGALDEKIPRECIIQHPLRYTQCIGQVEVTSFSTPHDSRASVGYVINGGGAKIGVATDIGYTTEEIEDALHGCETVVLEANHDVNMLMMGPYPYLLKQRILSQGGHLSNDQCAELAVRLAKSGTKCFVLAHLSEINNTPSIASKTVCSALRDAGYGGCRVLIADRDMPVTVSKEA